MKKSLIILLFSIIITPFLASCGNDEEDIIITEKDTFDYNRDFVLPYRIFPASASQVASYMKKNGYNDYRQNGNFIEYAGRGMTSVYLYEIENGKIESSAVYITASERNATLISEKLNSEYILLSQRGKIFYYEQKKRDGHALVTTTTHSSFGLCYLITFV